MSIDNRESVRSQLKRRGAPAGVAKVNGIVYQLVGDEERVDSGWEERNARNVELRWQSEREQRLGERKQAREGLSLGARLDRALFDIELGRGKAARPIATGRGSSEGSPGGVHPGHVSGPEIDRHRQLILQHIEAIEDARDAELGLLNEEPVGDRPGRTGEWGASGRMMSTSERDRVVFDKFQGVRSEVVAREFPHLGKSARTIERARVTEAERHGVVVRPVDGVVLGEITKGERVLRRVRIG